ncbi:MAG: nicotinamide riboside transporter PnuC [Oscillospiraceae bacterium]|nr:nicotinamide riboside transporter PnuC [Oscillospiraceae bacterium]MDY2847749.1 nicotinamide riboside transporter PnuC [Oscillospiraceae bacterium]
MNIQKLSSYKNYFTKTELILWSCSVTVIAVLFFVFDRSNYMSFAASLIGATSLIFNAKGNPIGQLLAVIFSVLYGIISYSCAYYGEMLTYLGMTAPMAVISLISWLKNPFDGSRAEVKVKRLGRGEIVLMCAVTPIITVIFYFILKFFNTANLIMSTLSVATSFLAVFLTAKRSPFFAVAYAANDIVLIIMWSMASIADMSYISVLICFVIFLANDIYGFLNWRKMEKRQLSACSDAR